MPSIDQLEYFLNKLKNTNSDAIIKCNDNELKISNTLAKEMLFYAISICKNDYISESDSDSTESLRVNNSIDYYSSFSD
jgi:hypothetical protein